MISFIHHPEGEERVGDLLVKNLQTVEWKNFRAAVAFAKRSGVKHLAKSLKSFASHGAIKMSVGIDHAGTSAEALTDLLRAVDPKGQIWIFHNETTSTFHPKIYLFSNDAKAECFIGSGNLTEGGLFINYEAFVHLKLDCSKPDDKKLLDHIESLLDSWTAASSGTAIKLTTEVIEELKKSGDLPTEIEIAVRCDEAKRVASATSPVAQTKKLFASVRVKPAPRILVEEARGKAVGSLGKRITAQGAFTTGGSGFVITLQNTDVGYGQKTAGAQRRSAELFIPKICVRSNPNFWGWPKLFKPDSKWTGPIDSEGFTKMDRVGVRMRLGTQVFEVNWWYNPDKKDYRLRHEALRSAGSVGDILRIELADKKKTGFDYYVEVIPQGTSLFNQYAALCTQIVRNSKKKFGYY